MGDGRCTEYWEPRGELQGRIKLGPRFHYSNIPERLCRLQRVRMLVARTFLGYRKRCSTEKGRVEPEININ